MIFSLLILSPPSSASSYSAYQFSKAVLTQGHSLYRVFFYHEGAYHGVRSHCVPQGEHNIVSSWRALQQDFSLDISVCIAAGLRRGILNETEAKRYQQEAVTLCPEFELAGLGQLIDATNHSDRTLTFGA